MSGEIPSEGAPAEAPTASRAQPNRRSRVTAIALLAAMFAFGSVTGVAVGRVWTMRDVRRMMEGPPGEARAGFRLEALRRHLDLRPDQTERIRAVITEADAERDKLMATCGPGLDDLRRRTDAKVREVLDEDQRKRFDEIGKRRGGGGRGGGGPWVGGPPPPP